MNFLPITIHRSHKDRHVKVVSNIIKGYKNHYQKIPVDAVISWVNVLDQDWLNKKYNFSHENKGEEDHFRFNSGSCNDCELYLCVQLILRNLPWLRTIFIVCMRPQKTFIFKTVMNLEIY